MRTHNSLQTKRTEKQRTLKDDRRTGEELVMSGMKKKKKKKKKKQLKEQCLCSSVFFRLHWVMFLKFKSFVT